MSSVHAHELKPPATVLDDPTRQKLIEQITVHGAHCTCGEPASDRDTDVLLDELHRDPEPVPYICDRCAEVDL